MCQKRTYPESKCICHRIPCRSEENQKLDVEVQKFEIKKNLLPNISKHITQENFERVLRQFSVMKS